MEESPSHHSSTPATPPSVSYCGTSMMRGPQTSTASSADVSMPMLHQQNYGVNAGASHRTPRFISLHTKMKILQEVEAGQHMKKDIAAKFGIPANTLSTILKNKDKVRLKYSAMLAKQDQSDELDEHTGWGAVGRDDFDDSPTQIVLKNGSQTRNKAPSGNGPASMLFPSALKLGGHQSSASPHGNEPFAMSTPTSGCPAAVSSAATLFGKLHATANNGRPSAIVQRESNGVGSAGIGEVVGGNTFASLFGGGAQATNFGDVLASSYDHEDGGTLNNDSNSFGKILARAMQQQQQHLNNNSQQHQQNSTPTQYSLQSSGVGQQTSLVGGGASGGSSAPLVAMLRSMLLNNPQTARFTAAAAATSNFLNAAAQAKVSNAATSLPAGNPETTCSAAAMALGNLLTQQQQQQQQHHHQQQQAPQPPHSVFQMTEAASSTMLGAKRSTGDASSDAGRKRRRENEDAGSDDDAGGRPAGLDLTTATATTSRSVADAKSDDRDAVLNVDSTSPAPFATGGGVSTANGDQPPPPAGGEDPSHAAGVDTTSVLLGILKFLQKLDERQIRIEDQLQLVLDRQTLEQRSYQDLVERIGGLHKTMISTINGGSNNNGYMETSTSTTATMTPPEDAADVKLEHHETVEKNEEGTESKVASDEAVSN